MYVFRIQSRVVSFQIADRLRKDVSIDQTARIIERLGTLASRTHVRKHRSVTTFHPDDFFHSDSRARSIHNLLAALALLIYEVVLRCVALSIEITLKSTVTSSKETKTITVDVPGRYLTAMLHTSSCGSR